MKSNIAALKEGYELFASKEKIKEAGRTLTLRLIIVLSVFLVVLVSGLLTFLFIYILQYNHVFTGIKTSSSVVVLVSLLFCLVVATVLIYVVWPLMFRPLDNVIKSMGKAAEGDFSGEVSTKRCHGDVRTLVVSYNNMLSELSGIEMFREDFISNFSHELKTPIVSINGFAGQLLRDDLSDEKRREYEEMIVSETEKLTNMSSSVLLLTKLESQGMVSGQKWFPLDEQLRECLLRFQSEWERKNLELDLELEPVSCYGSPKMLEHIWNNLISNAVKFSYPGGELGLGCRSIPGAVEAYVCDSGPGMDDKTMKHIFEKFYQGDSAHASAGNGLGLSIVKRVVELSSGQIKIRSAPGIGSIFTVTLPLPDEQN